MPKLSSIRVEVLRDLIEQLRFSSPAAASRHIERAEALAAEIQPQQNYPLEWILFKLTDYRSDEVSGLVTGQALLSDLSAIVEHLCQHAELSRETLPEHLSLDALCERWNVSPKTIERYRRRGLIARRLPGGRASTHRMIFTLEVVEHFEHAHADLLRKAGRFDRMTDEQAERAIRRVQRYERLLGMTRSQALERTAARLGRSREALRLLLQVHDPIDRPAISDRELIDAWRRGESFAAIARPLSLPATTIRSRVLAARVDRLKSLLGLLKPGSDVRAHLAHEPSPLDAPALASLPMPNVHPGQRTTLGEMLDAMQQRTVPMGAQERLVGKALAALRLRTFDAIETLSPAATLLDAIETDLRYASRLKAVLAGPLMSVAGAQVREVLGQASDRMTSAHWQSLLNEVLASMSSALNNWDPWSVGRPAGAVGVAVARTTTRWLSAQPGLTSSAKGSAAHLLPLDEPLEPWPLRLDPWQAWLEPPALDLGPLKPEDATLLANRLGLGEPPTTARALAMELGITPAAAESRARRILRAATAAPPTPSSHA